MARELSLEYPGSGTTYAIIRRMSDDYVWNGSAFAVWADGSIATYDIPLTSRGGDVFNADFPSAITAGNYRIMYYEQAGAAPATTDLLLTKDELYWNGTTTSSASTVTLDPYALTSLENLKTYLKITDSTLDTFLTLLINSVSAKIERVCNRKFLSREYKERYNLNRQKRVQLRQFPVTYISRVAYGHGSAGTLTYAGTDIQADASITGTALRLVSTSAAGTRTINNLLFTSYPTLSLLTAAVNAITGWEMTALLDMPCIDLNPAAGLAANDTVIELTYPDVSDTDFVADYQRGQIEFSRTSYGFGYRWGSGSGVSGLLSGFHNPVASYPSQSTRRMPVQFQGMFVVYTAGYDTVPADVEAVCWEIISEKYHLADRDPNVKYTTFGPLSIAFNNQDELKVESQLARYMDGGGMIAGM